MTVYEKLLNNLTLMLEDCKTYGEAEGLKCDQIKARREIEKAGRISNMTMILLSEHFEKLDKCINYYHFHRS